VRVVIDYSFGLDEQGAPVLFTLPASTKPDKPEAEPERDVKSSARRRDAVVEAARTLDDLSPTGVERLARLRWRGERPITAEDFAAFSADARAQRLHDVVDALDHRVRRGAHGRANARQVHVSLPRGVAAKALASLEPEELSSAFERLREKGWSDQQIYRHGVRRLDGAGKMREMLVGKEGES
jgi:hypothetical protein